MDTDTLKTLAHLYAAHTGLKLATVSTYAANDGKFFKSLEDGSGCTVKRANRLIAWFSQNWPNDLVWPTEVQRPSKKKEAA
ncbi:MAG: hypothetical protein GOVbin287_6 [Prokaryotic dsDNA virus sp.]|nr:MAG: hypothetical protein GOVbin287_6 [Prokaryotic dsDNA virus sp.]